MEITTVNWAIPNSSNADFIINRNLDSLTKSFNYLHQFSGLNDTKLKSFLAQNREALRKNMPQALLYHEFIVRNVEDTKFEPQRVFNHMLTELKEVSDKPLEIVPFGKRYQIFTNGILQALIAEDHLKCYGEHLAKRNQGIVSPSSEQFQHTLEEINRCLSYIKQSCSTLYKEVETVISQIHIMSSPHVNAGSYLSMLGMFNIRYLKSDVEHWSRLAEHIIHETAHNLLYQLWYQDKIITNDHGLFYTPFRKDERPISGVFHAMFVLARTIYGFNQLLANPDIELKKTDIISHYNEANNKLSFTDKFLQTVEVTDRSERLTNFGVNIRNDCVTLVERCKYQV
ncbi:HEXXH motif-containing putative peptide modification protein [Vibrio splendidus]